MARLPVQDTDFCCGLPPWLKVTEMGNARLELETGRLDFRLPETVSSISAPLAYSNAQVTDYMGLKRAEYPWSPPLRMRVVARFHQPLDGMRGTAGFGLWNQPLMPGQRWPRLPRAAWFFLAGTPCNLELAHGIPGRGFKAATLDATRPAFLALAPTAPIAVLLMRNKTLYDRLYPIGQRALGVSEALIEGIEPGRDTLYEMEWREDGLTFRVDHNLVMETMHHPGRPLGFIAWMDNQYAVVTPRGSIGGGVTRIISEQRMSLMNLRIEPL